MNVKWTWIGLIFGVASSISSLGQQRPPIELTGAYQFFRAYNVNAPAGWNGSVHFPVNDWFGFVGDYGGGYKSEFGISTTLHTFGGGPQFTLRTHTVEPFFRVILGAAHGSVSTFGYSASDTAFMASPGGGANFRASDRIWLHLGVNYPVIHKYGYTADAIEADVGITFKFGGRSKHADSGSGRIATERNAEAGMVVPALAIRVGPAQEEGAEIVEVQPGGTADMAGLRVGDVIRRVDGKEVKTPMDLAVELSNRPAGSQVHLVYRHKYWESEANVLLNKEK